MRALVLAVVVGACAAPAGSAADGGEGSDAGQSFACEASASADGISLTIAAHRCSFHVGESADFVYFGMVAADAPALHVAVGAASCHRPTADPNADVRWRIDPASGSDPHYCPDCDLGRCPPNDAMDVKLTPGSFEGTAQWSGRSWDGPSDYNAPYGDAFSPGSYVVEVTLGTVTARLPIEVTP